MKKCRTCGMLVGKRPVKDLMRDLSLNDMVREFLRIDVHQHDGLTHIICRKCTRKVIDFEKFYKNSKRVQPRLLEELHSDDLLRRSKQQPKERRRVAPLSNVTNVHPVPGTSSSDASQIHGNGPTLAVPRDSDNDWIRGPIIIELDESEAVDTSK